MKKYQSGDDQNKDEFIIVRPVRRDDIKPLAEMYVRLASSLYSQGAVLSETFQQLYIKNKFEQLKNIPDTELKMAGAFDKNNLLLGAIEYQYDSSGNIFIYEEFVEQKRQRTGTALVNYLIEAGRKTRAEYLYVDASGDGIGFYRQAGFVNGNQAESPFLARMYFKISP